MENTPVFSALLGANLETIPMELKPEAAIAALCWETEVDDMIGQTRSCSHSTRHSSMSKKDVGVQREATVLYSGKDNGKQTA